MRKLATLSTVILLAVLFTGCDLVPGQHMRDQAKWEPDEQSDIFGDGTVSRHPPANTIPYGTLNLQLNEPFMTGVDAEGNFLTEIPMEVNLAVVERGQNRYNVFCAPCHGHLGNGLGMIVQRGQVQDEVGLKQPNSFHQEAVRNQPVGYYYNAITNGFATMYSYASRIEPQDRWAIVAYIRALQLSQRASVTDVPEDVLEQLEAASAEDAEATEDTEDTEDHNTE